MTRSVPVVDMALLRARALNELEDAFRTLEKLVPPPVRVPWQHSFVFRYREKTIQQAIVQKLARQLSGLHAIDVLHRRGLFQEQGLIHRVVDEIKEDIIFLSLAVIRNDGSGWPSRARQHRGKGSD